MTERNPRPSTLDELREFVTRKLGEARQSDYYALLDLTRDCDPSTVDDAYQVVLDRLDGSDLKRPEAADLWLPIQRIHRELARAYSVLSDPHRRAGYDRRTGGQHAWPVRQAWSTVASARMDASTGATAVARVVEARGDPPLEEDRDPTPATALHALARRIRDTKVADAEELLRRALALEPNKPIHKLELGWLLVTDKERLTPERMRESRDLLQEACMETPWDAHTRYRMAQFWRDAGSPRRYRLELEATLRCDHQHELASAELAAVRDAEDPLSQVSWPKIWRRMASRRIGRTRLRRSTTTV